MLFFELSLYTGNERYELLNTLVTLVNKTQSLKINYLIQAGSIHLAFLRMKDNGVKDEERQKVLQEKLRKNPYATKVDNFKFIIHVVL